MLAKSGIATGGTASKVLRKLEISGFIKHLDCYPNNHRLAKYRLIDQYSLFYLKWVEQTERLLHTSGIKNYWMQQSNTNAWIVWCGYAFENICLLHVDKIQNALGLSGIFVNQHTWYSIGDDTSLGAKIDLVLDRADNCINLCECKYYNDKFEVTKKYGEELNRKKRYLEIKQKIRKVFLLL